MIETDRLVAADRVTIATIVKTRWTVRLDRAGSMSTLGNVSAGTNGDLPLGGARPRGTARPYLDLWPPGLGKTTLASIIAEEMGVQLKTTSGPFWKRPVTLRP